MNPPVYVGNDTLHVEKSRMKPMSIRLQVHGVGTDNSARFNNDYIKKSNCSTTNKICTSVDLAVKQQKQQKGQEQQRKVGFQSDASVVEIERIHDIVVSLDDCDVASIDEAKSSLWYSKDEYTRLFTEASFDTTWKSKYDQRRISNQHHCTSTLMKLQEEQDAKEKVEAEMQQQEKQQQLQQQQQSDASSRRRRPNPRERRHDREQQNGNGRRQRSLPTKIQEETAEEGDNVSSPQPNDGGRPHSRPARERRPTRGGPGKARSAPPTRSMGHQIANNNTATGPRY